MTLCNVRTPCPECPWSRGVKPGALGGSPPEVYIGQAAGHYVLPCHKHCDFSDPNWRVKAIDTPQCAGAAIFRANIGIDGYMPSKIHRLPANPVDVFATSAEFLAYHRCISLGEAAARLKVTPPHRLLELQLARDSNIFYTVKG